MIVRLTSTRFADNILKEIENRRRQMMFTVTHVDYDDISRLYAAIFVTHFPKSRTIHEGTPAERTQPPSVFLLGRWNDTSGTHIYAGDVYVMNKEGKTVAHFRLDPPPKVG